MPTDWLFWGIAAAAAALCLGVVLAPLLAGAGAGRRGGRATICRCTATSSARSTPTRPAAS